MSETIDETDSGGVPRRTFIVQSTWLAAAAALAACGGGGGADFAAPPLPSNGTANSIDVKSFPSLSSVGGIAILSLSGVQLAIVRTGESSFIALSRVCPHQGGIVQQSGTGFQCPVHGARFSQTGQWTGGQRTSSLHSYVTSYDPTTGVLAVT